MKKCFISDKTSSEMSLSMNEEEVVKIVSAYNHCAVKSSCDKNKKERSNNMASNFCNRNTEIMHTVFKLPKSTEHENSPKIHVYVINNFRKPGFHVYTLKETSRLSTVSSHHRDVQHSVRKVAISESNFVLGNHSGDKTSALAVDKCDKKRVSDVDMFSLSVNTAQKIMDGGHMKTNRQSLWVVFDCNKALPVEDSHKEMMYPMSCTGHTDEEEEQISLENNTENNETRYSFDADSSVNNLAHCSESNAYMCGADSTKFGSVSKYSCAETHVVMNGYTGADLYVHNDDKCGLGCRTECTDNCYIGNNNPDHQVGSSREIDNVDSGSVYHVNDCIGGSDFEGSVKADVTVVSEITKHKLEFKKEDKDCNTENSYFETFPCSSKDASIQTDSHCTIEQNISSHSKGWLTYTKTKEGTFVRITDAPEQTNVTEVKPNDGTKYSADEKSDVSETSKHGIKVDYLLKYDGPFDMCMLHSEKSWVNNDADNSEFASQPKQTNDVSGRIAGRTLIPDNEIDEEHRRPTDEQLNEHVVDISSVKDCCLPPCVVISKFDEVNNLTIVQNFAEECNPNSNILKKTDLSLIDVPFHFVFKEDGEKTYVVSTRGTSCLSLVDIVEESCVPLLEICVLMAGSDTRTSGDRYDTPSIFGIVHVPQDTSCIFMNMMERGGFLNSTNVQVFNIADGANKGSVSPRYSAVETIKQFSDIGLKMCESLDEIDNETHLPITYYDAETKTYVYGSSMVDGVNLVVNIKYKCLSLICTVCKTCFLDGNTHVRDRFLTADETTEIIYEHIDNSAWETWAKMGPYVEEVFKNDTDMSLTEFQIGKTSHTSMVTNVHNMVANESGQLDLSDTQITTSLIEIIGVPWGSKSEFEKIFAVHMANASFNIFLYLVDIETWNKRPVGNNDKIICQATINLYSKLKNNSTCFQFKLLIQSMKPGPKFQTAYQILNIIERIRYLNIPKAQCRIEAHSTCALVLSGSEGCNFTNVFNRKETSVTTMNSDDDVIKTRFDIPKKAGESVKEFAEDTNVSKYVNNEATTYMYDTTKETGSQFVVNRYDKTDTMLIWVDITCDTDLLLLLLNPVDKSKNTTKRLVDSEERKCADLVGMFAPIVEHEGEMNRCLVKYSQTISPSMNAFEDVTCDYEINVGAKISEHSKNSIKYTCSADVTIHTDDVVSIADERHVSMTIRSISQIERAIMCLKMMPRGKYLYIAHRDIIVFCVDGSEKPKKLDIETTEQNCVSLGTSGYGHCVTIVQTDCDEKVNIFDIVTKVYFSNIYVVDMACSTVFVPSEKTSEYQNEKRSLYSILLMSDRSENICVADAICVNVRFSSNRIIARLIKSSQFTTLIEIIANETIWNAILSHIDDIFNEYDFGASVDCKFCKSACVHIIDRNNEDVDEIHTETDEQATKIGQDYFVSMKVICKETIRRLLQIIWEMSVCVVGNSTPNNNIKGAKADRLTINSNSMCVSLLNSLHKYGVSMVQYDKDTLSCFVGFENVPFGEAGSNIRKHINRYKLHVHPKYGSYKVVSSSVANVVEQLSDGEFDSGFTVNACGQWKKKCVDLHKAELNVKTRNILENTAMALGSLKEKEFRLLGVPDYENGIYKYDGILCLPAKSTYSEMVSVRANESDAYLCTPVFDSVANMNAEPEITGDDSCKPFISDERIDECVYLIRKESCFHVAKRNTVKNICPAEKRHRIMVTGYYMLNDGEGKDACVHLINDGADCGEEVANDDIRWCDCLSDTANLPVVIIDFSNEFLANNEHVMDSNTDIGVNATARPEQVKANMSVITDVIDTGGPLNYSDTNNGGYVPNILEETCLAVYKTDLRAYYHSNTETYSIVIDNSAEIVRLVVDNYSSYMFTRVADVREQSFLLDRGDESRICGNVVDVKEESYLYFSRASAFDVLVNEQAQANAPFDFAQTQAKVVITDSLNDINSPVKSLVSLDSYDVPFDSHDAFVVCGVCDINSDLNEHTFAKKVNIFPRSVAEDLDVDETYVKAYKNIEESSRLMNNKTLKFSFQTPIDKTEIHVYAVPFTELYREQGRNSEFSLDNNSVADASAASQPLSSDVSHDGPILPMGSRSDNNSEHNFPVISLSTNITVDLHPDRDIHPIVDLHPNHHMRPFGLDRGDALNPPIISLASQFTVDLSRTRGTRLVVAASEFLPRPNLIALRDYR